MYECGTGNTKEEPPLRVLEKRVPIKVFEAKRKVATVGWGKTTK